jgi:hypothetical protein
MYYSTNEELKDFERKIVKVGLEDACEKVRKNMRQILENVEQMEKENVVMGRSDNTSLGKVSKVKSKTSNGNVARG